MLAATPPRRISRSSTRKETESLSQLLDDEGVGELAAEGHQVVGGDGSGDQQGHVASTSGTSAKHRDATDAYSWAYPPVAPSVEHMSAWYDAGQPARRRTPTRGRWLDARLPPERRRLGRTPSLYVRRLPARPAQARDPRSPRPPSGSPTRCTCTWTDPAPGPEHEAPDRGRGLSLSVELSGSESPQAQEPVALGLSMVKPCFSMVSTKSIIGAVEVGDAHPVDDHGHAVEVGDDVTVEAALVEEELVAQTRAAAGLHGDAQREVVATLLLEEALHLRRRPPGSG